MKTITFFSITFYILISCEVQTPNSTHSPEISITEPYNNQVVSGIIGVKFSSSDYRSVEKIELWIDSSYTGLKVTGTPFKVKLNTEIFSIGSHYIYAKCYDFWDDITQSEKIIIYIDNLNEFPEEVILYPISYQNAEFNILWSKSQSADFFSYALFESFNSDMTDSVLIYKTQNILDTNYVVQNVQLNEKRYYRIAIQNTKQLVSHSNIEVGSNLPRILFSSTLDGNANLYTVDIDGDNLTQLTESKNNKLSPKFNPDGNHILYVKINPNWIWDIIILNIYTGEEFKVGKNVYGASLPIFNSNGSEIIYSSYLNGPSDIFITKIFEGIDINITNSTNYSENRPAFSPDNQSICFVSENDSGRSIINSDVGGSNLKLLTDVSGQFTSAPTLFYSPDGNSIMYSYKDKLQIIDIISGENTTVYEDEGLQAYCYSPDGKDILFKTKNISLYKINTDGNNLVELLFENERIGKASYLPDGSKIIFDTGGRLNIMNPDGSSKVQITNNDVPYISFHVYQYN